MAWRGFQWTRRLALTTRWRRLAALATIVILLGAGVGGLYLYRQFQAGQQASQQRAAGVQAYAHGDYAKAVRDLADYVRWRDDDSDAQLRLAHAAMKLAHPQMRDLALALRALTKVHELKPGDRRAAHELLELNLLLQRNQPALDLANDLLERDARDVAALESKAVALARLNQPEAALKAAQACLKLDANRWRVHLLALQLDKQLHTAPAKLLARATHARQAHPHDPRFALIQAMGYAAAGDEAKTRQWLLAAAEQAPADDSAFAMQLVRYLDLAQLYQASMRVLDRAAGAKPRRANEQNNDRHDALTPFGRDQHDAARREWVRRLMEDGRFADAADQLKALNADTSAAETQMLAIEAFALQQLGKDDEARSLVAALAGRKADVRAKSWAALLAARQAHEPPSKMLPLYLDAVKAAPRNAYFQALLAEALTAMDEPERALRAWQAAQQARETWWLPFTRAAEILRQLHRTDAAVRQARSGLTRAPHRVVAAVAWASARADQLSASSFSRPAPRSAPPSDTASAAAGTQPDRRVALLDFVERILKAAPGQEQALLLKVRLLAQLDQHDAAARTVRAVLAGKSSPAATTLLALADLSKRFELGLAQACRDRCEALYGVTPAMALQQARQLAAQGRAKDGLTLLERAAAKQSGSDASGGTSGGASGGASGGWALAKARYLEATHDPRARTQWQTLARRYPRNAHLLQLALRAPSTQHDRKLTAALLDDLGRTIGHDSVQWRIERARWLLTGKPSTDAAAEAQGLLTQVLRDAPDRVEPHVLLAQAQTQLNLLPQAIHELQAAARQRPDNTIIQMTLAMLYQRTQQYSLAAACLHKAAAAPGMSAAQRETIAAMFAAQGETEQALRVLKQLDATGRSLSASSQLLLARLYAQAGQTARAAALCRVMLEHPTAAAIRFVADFYAGRNKPVQAQQVLALLDKLALPADGRALIRAAAAADRGDEAEAVKQLKAATAANPSNADAWRQLVAATLQRQGASQAIAMARAALANVPDDAALRAVEQRTKAVLAAGDDGRVNALLAQLLRQSPPSAVLTNALDVLTRALAKPWSARDVAAKMAALADGAPRILVLQIVAIESHLAAGQTAQAATLAQRTLQRFPTAAQPAMLAAQAHAHLRQWPAAMAAAQAWRRRDSAQAAKADVVIAQAKLALGDAGGAAAVLEPYLTPADHQSPAPPEAVTIEAARIMLAQGHVAQARALLEPTLSRSANWRTAWERFAAVDIADGDTAAQWLHTVRAKIPAAAVTEQVTLAQSWWYLGDRLNRPEARAQGRRIIDEVVQSPKAPPRAWLLRGMMAQRAQQRDAAVASYRKALTLRPGYAAAQNNLAMMLLNDPAAKEQAMRLAQAAVRAEPTNAQYLDTLAAAQAQARQYQPAVTTIKRAIALEPTNPNWQARLNQIEGKK